MPKFDTYSAQVNPYSGGTGQAIQEYDPNLDNAKMNVVRAGNFLGDRIQQIQNYREEANNIKINSEFRLKGLAALRGAMARKGEQAIGLTDTMTKAFDDEINKTISNYQGNEFNRTKLQNTLKQDAFAMLSSISAHEAAEGDVYNKQVIDSSFIASDAMLRTYASDDAKSQEIIDGQLAVVKARSGDPNLLLQTKIRLTEARIDELNKINPDRAKAFLQESKNLLGASYDKILKDVEINRVKRDALIDPMGTLAKLSDMQGGYVDVDLATKADMTQYVIGQISQRATAEKQALDQRNEAAKQGIIDLLVKGDELQAMTSLEELRSKRVIDSATYRDVLKFIKDENVTSDPDATNELEWNIITGKAGFRDIANADGLSRKDKTRLATKLRSYQDSDLQKTVLKQQSYQWVLNTAKSIIDPPGVMSTPESKTAALEFERSLFKATNGGKTEIDPYAFYHENIWQYTTNIIPKTKYGTPNSLEDIGKMKAKFAEDAKSMTVQEVNIESAKIKRAETILNELKRAKENAGNRKTK